MANVIAALLPGSPSVEQNKEEEEKEVDVKVDIDDDPVLHSVLEIIAELRSELVSLETDLHLRFL